MRAHQQAFLDLAIEQGALKFGRFTLKSGRESPYFFNAGALHSGKALGVLGQAYAATIVASGIPFDVLFGPAYKGIPLAAVTAASLYRDHGLDVLYAFNRKEPKAHGEGGSIVGAPLAGRVLIVDDVITAGTAIRESLEIIRGQGAEPAGVVIALDREERGQGERSAVQEVEQDHGLPVASIVGLSELIAYIRDRGQDAQLAAMQQYRARYGVPGI